MWDGVTYVDGSWSPILAEGKEATRLLVTNAGPVDIVVKGWPLIHPAPGADPDVALTLQRGNTVCLSACLIRVVVARPDLQGFAAVGWRVAS